MLMKAGSNVMLTKENPDLTTAVIGFGWDVITPNGPAPEIVPSAIICGEDGTALKPDSFVFFNQTLSDDGHVEFVVNGDKEQMEVDIGFIPSEIHRIVFVVYVNPEKRRAGNFSSMRSAYISVSKPDGLELIRFEIPSDRLSNDMTAMIFGELYRYKGEWKFKAVGQGYSNGLAGVAETFKVEI